jgi:hypothetical protein
MPEILKEFVSVGYILLQLTFVLTIPLRFHKMPLFIETVPQEVKNGKGEEGNFKKAVLNRLYGDCADRFSTEKSFFAGQRFSLSKDRDTVDLIGNGGRPTAQ